MARPTSQLQDPTLLAAALEGLELQKRRIEEQISMVRSMLSGKKTYAPAAPAAPAESSSSSSSSRSKRILSPEARQRIAAAQKRRWAAFRKGKKDD